MRGTQNAPYFNVMYFFNHFKIFKIAQEVPLPVQCFQSFFFQERIINMSSLFNMWHVSPLPTPRPVLINILVHPLSLSRVQLFVTPWTVARQALLSMGFSWQEYLEWVAISSSRGSSQSRVQTHISWVSCICRQILYHWAILFDEIPPSISFT